MAIMLKHLYDIPALTVALVEGGAFGGGAGLAAACDMAIAVKDAKFAFSEVKLGLIAATISPYVVARHRPAAGAAAVLHGRGVRRRAGAARSGWSTRWSTTRAALEAAKARIAGRRCWPARRARSAQSKRLVGEIVGRADRPRR